MTLKDYSKLYSAALSIQSIPLKFPDQFNILFEDEKVKLQDEIEKDKKKDDCDKSVKIVSKLYFSRDQLLDDNNKQVYFDKKYDDTNYGLIDDFDKEMMSKTPEEFIMFLTNKLKNDKRLSDEDAEYLADSLISGYKKVLNGQYAILKLINENGPYFEYYVRKNNEWILDPNQKDIDQEEKMGISDSNILCNLQEKCISVPEKIGDKCESIEINKMELQQNVLKDIMHEFDEKYFENKTEFEEKINKKYNYLFEILRIVGRLETENMLKYNNQKYKIGYKLDDGFGNGTGLPVIVSPFAKYRDLIMGQSDFIKKQHDIIKFIKICTRPFVEDGLGPLGTRESPHWLYCIETGVELLPTFKLNLAAAYLNDTSNYNDYMDLIIKQIGVLSDDGDKWVDKYSGYTIKYIDFNVEEGYEGGFKISSRGVLKEDAGNKLMTSLDKNELKFETPESKMISNVVTALSVAIGINIEYQKEFIINCVTEVLKNTLEDEEDYKKRIKEISNKPNAKVPMSYEDLYYTSILYYTLGMFLIAVQTSIPSVKTRKTFPGCVRSFVGYPFDGAGDMTSLKYLSCICYQIRKNTAKPWYILKSSKEEYIANKISLVINEHLLKLPDVKQKISEKNEYLLLNPKEEIPKEHNVANWIEFLPPLTPFKIKNLVNISSEFKQSLLQSLRSGSKKQEEQILVVNSKIIQFSLAIQERIQEIVKKKDLTLSKINNEYYLENSCCQEKNKDQKSTIAYFEKEDPRITDYNKIVENLTNIMQDITNYTKAELLYSPINTKNIYPPIKKEFDSKTIYYAFVDFCHFNSLLPIPEDLLPLCSEKPQNIVAGSAGDSRDEIVKKLKENGVNYSLESFLRMLQIVSRNNIIDIDIYKPIITSLRKLTALLEEMENENEEIVEPSLRKLLLNAMDTFSIASDVSTPQIKDLNNFLVKQTKIMKLDVIDFINQNKGSNITRKQIKNVLGFIDVITNWKSEESNVYSFIRFFQSFIENFTMIFPNIILNKVDYKENIIPNYLGLSKNHQKKIKDDISNYYEKLRMFYNVPGLTNILQNIQKSCDNLLKLSKNTPSFATTHKNGKELKPIFDERTSKLLFEYYFFRVLIQYTYLCDDDRMIVREVRKTQEVQDLFSVDYIDETNASLDINVEIGNDREEDITVLRGNKRDLKIRVANLLIEFLSVMETHKDVVDISYDDVLDRVFKLKEREKDIITDRLKFMTDEERDADTILKINKLGVWNKGLQKGLTSYVKENYDEEREFMEQMLNYEKQAQSKMKNSNYDATSAGFVLDDFIDEIERDAEIEREAYDISGYSENFMNGEFEGDEVDNYEDYE